MSGAAESQADQPHVIVGTAGHIDHGKTALVKALTGIDADRLAEEKRRGITIELGFVFMDTPGLSRQVVFIDVPGHEKLIRTMVAGSAHLDAALLVVAANEGVRAQTREHLDILRLLQVPRGLLALTKLDLADAELRELVCADLEQLVAGSLLQGAPILPVSAVTGEGVADLRAALVALARQVPPRAGRGPLRLPVDRVFTKHGFGTVIAGTILSGEVAVGEELEIYPLRITARVRGIEVHNQPCERSGAGRRTALNLSGVDRELLRRGHWVARPGELTPTWRMDVRLTLLDRAPEPLRRVTRMRLHLGTGEILARVALLDATELAPGAEGLAQLELERPTLALPGDRFVLRSLTPALTIGGGLILDAHPGRHRRFDQEAIAALERLAAGTQQAVEQVFAQSGPCPQSAAQVAVRLGEDEASVEAAIESLLAADRLLALSGTPEGYVHAQAYRERRRAAQEALREFFARQPFRVLMPEAHLRAQLGGRQERSLTERVLEDLVREQVLFRRGAAVGLSGREPELSERQQQAAATLERVYRAAGLSAPREAELRERLGLPAEQFEQVIVSLLEQGRLVRLGEQVTYHAQTLRAAEEVLRDYLTKHPSVEVAAFRDHLGVSRKYALALLEHFDRAGLTVRYGEGRVRAG